MEKKQNKYSEYKLGKIDIETEKAFLALIDGFVDTPIWIPKSVVDPENKLIKQWFIDQKNKELKDFMRLNKNPLSLYFSKSTQDKTSRWLHVVILETPSNFVINRIHVPLSSF